MNKRLSTILYLGFLAALPLITFDIYQPALPAITRYFNTSHSLGQLTLSLFFFLLGVSQIIWGPLIDHFGRNKTFYASLYLFFLATLVCLFAQSIYLLILGRILQGFSICCANVMAFSSSRDIEDSTERAKLLSHIAMVISVSPIFAPLIGAFIFKYFGWHALFIFILILGFILLVVSRLKLKESIHWVPPVEKFSFRKTLTIYKSIIKDKLFFKITAITTISFSASMIAIVNAAYIIIDNLHFSPQTFAIIFAANGFMVILGNFLGIVLRNTRSLVWNIRLGASLMVIGALLTALGFLFYGLTLITLTPILIINLGVILLTAPSYSLALANFTRDAASAMALLNMIRMSLSSLISALISSLIIYNILILALGMLTCALTSLFFSLALKEPSSNASGN